MKKSIITLFILLSALSVKIVAQDKPITEICIPCEKLIELKLPDVKITSAITVTQVPSHCKVMGVIGKEINFELLLPLDWNGIYVMGGGGGFVGSIQNMAAGKVKEGYATSGTDTGHKTEGLGSANWALNDMERQVNFGHLAVHRTIEVSKAIIGNYYGKWPKYSYFMGCSRGGGQAMMEAQRYPDDFDGIIAGAPAFDWIAIAVEAIQNTQAVYPTKLTESILTKEHIKILQEAVLKQCDLLDGVADSIINNPANCKFDFATLPMCQGDVPGKGCFTTAQVKAIKTIYDGFDIGNGIKYPGFPFGGENEGGGWITWITGPNEMTTKNSYPSLIAYFGIEIFKYLILQDPNWNYLDYKFSGYEKEMRYAAAYLNATSVDYSGFKNRKGKIIFYHGWNDPALSALSTIDHYNAVKTADPAIDNYMRLYLLPGVLHCGGGEGPSDADLLPILRDWVENGKPPERVVVTKKVLGKEVMSRPVYPYPQEAIYDGKGNPNVESSYKLKK
jgi:feruloyl esterase